MPKMRRTDLRSMELSRRHFLVHGTLMMGALHIGLTCIPYARDLFLSTGGLRRHIYPGPLRKFSQREIRKPGTWLG